MEIFLNIVIIVAVLVWDWGMLYLSARIKDRFWSMMVGALAPSGPVFVLLTAGEESFLHWVAFFALGSGAVGAYSAGALWQQRNTNAVFEATIITIELDGEAPR